MLILGTISTKRSLKCGIMLQIYLHSNMKIMVILTINHTHNHQHIYSILLIRHLWRIDHHYWRTANHYCSHDQVIITHHEHIQTISIPLVLCHHCQIKALLTTKPSKILLLLLLSVVPQPVLQQEPML